MRQAERSLKSRWWSRLASAAALVPAGLSLAALSACSQYEPVNTRLYLEKELHRRLPPELASRVRMPFELDPVIEAEVEQRLSPAGSERRRTDEVLEFIFGWLDLEYSLTPTRDAVETFHTAEGNCLSFVNLFVGIGRKMRLNPFYVEVEDYQRWNYRDGVVVSRGHIVAGIHIFGDMSTYDFLPYRPKSYRDFKPIDDLTAVAHYYNNLGAEALMRDDPWTAREPLEIAVALAPDFDKALNNLGVALSRLGETARAVEIYERGLELHPTNVPLMTNLARAHQTLGNGARAAELLNALDDVNQTNPFFFVYRGDMALGEGDAKKALSYMRQALRTDSEVPEVHVGLVRVYLVMGELGKARHHVERALKLDATHEEARKYAAMLDRGDVGLGGRARR